MEELIAGVAAEEFVVSLEAVEAMPGIVAAGFAAGVLVVSAVSLVVSGFKALLRIIGR